MSFKMPPFDKSYTTFYWSVIVSIARCCTVFELSLTLNIWVRGHSRTSKLVPFESFVASVFYLSSIVTMAVSLTVYEIFSSQNSMTLKSGLGIVQGHRKWRRSIDYRLLSIGPPL